MIMRFFALGALLVAACSTNTPAPANKPTEIVMGFNPAENADAVEMNSNTFSAYYREQTGIAVKIFIATDYTALIEALRSGQIQFAWLPPFSFVKAEEIADAQVLLKAVRGGHAHFYSAIITRSDRADINSIDDLRGKNIAWVDPSSASGHIFPKASLMAKKNIDPDSFFNKQIFAGSHDALVLAVLNGTVDAGATFTNDVEGKHSAWTQYLKGDEAQRIKLIYVTDPITGDTLATTKKFAREHADIVQKTTALLQTMSKSDAGRKILQDLYRIDSMVPAQSADYEPVRTAARALKILDAP